METSIRVEEHRNRVKQLKLRKCMQTLKSAGVTIEELQKYMDEVGFSSQEEKRRKKLDTYRREEKARLKRLEGLEKARIARAKKAEEKAKQQEETKNILFEGSKEAK